MTDARMDAALRRLLAPKAETPKRRFAEHHSLHNLLAFLAVLGAIVTLALAGKATDLAIMTGLIGVLGSFRPWASASGPAGTKSDPVAVEGAEEGKKPVETEVKE